MNEDVDNTPQSNQPHSPPPSDRNAKSESYEDHLKLIDAAQKQYREHFKQDGERFDRMFKTTTWLIGGFAVVALGLVAYFYGKTSDGLRAELQNQIRTEFATDRIKELLRDEAKEQIRTQVTDLLPAKFSEAVAKVIRDDPALLTRVKEIAEESARRSTEKDLASREVPGDRLSPQQADAIKSIKPPAKGIKIAVVFTRESPWKRALAGSLRNTLQQASWSAFLRTDGVSAGDGYGKGTIILSWGMKDPNSPPTGKPIGLDELSEALKGARFTVEVRPPSGASIIEHDPQTLIAIVM